MIKGYKIGQNKASIVFPPSCKILLFAKSVDPYIPSEFNIRIKWGFLRIHKLDIFPRSRKHGLLLETEIYLFGQLNIWISKKMIVPREIMQILHPFWFIYTNSSYLWIWKFDLFCHKQSWQNINCCVINALLDKNAHFILYKLCTMSTFSHLFGIFRTLYFYNKITLCFVVISSITDTQYVCI